MTLGFSTHANGKPTLFTNKIAKCMWMMYPKKMKELALSRPFPSFYVFEDLTVMEQELLVPKKHSIRSDPKNRWKPGMNIHFVINNRTPNRFQFAPAIPCVSIQEIGILWTSSPYHKKCVGVYIDWQPYGFAFGQEEITEYDHTLHELAINDGFDSVQDFLRWFPENFTGKIIHWTGLSYQNLFIYRKTN